MSNIDQIPLASLRPDKFDDVAVKDQILLIQRECEDADPDVIALVFHECDYNMRKTIARIKAGDFQDGEWQTAKSTNKKKMSNHQHQHPSTDQIGNGNTLSDSERSGSQRTSPTSSLRGGYRRNDRFGYSASTRTDTRRRGTDPGRNQFNNSRYPMPKSVASNPSETSFPAPQLSTEDIPQMTSSLVDQYDHQTQSLTFDNSQKTVPSQSSSKRPLQSSAFTRMPVLMHPAVRFSSQSIDIQFGDIQWQDSMLVAVAPSNEIFNGSNNNNNEEEEEEELSSMVNTENQDIHEILSSNYPITHHQPANDTDNHLLETTGSLSITNAPIVSPENTSHLSDHLTHSNQYSSQSQEPVQIPINRLPPTSTPRPSEYSSPTSQPIPNTIHNDHHHHQQQQQHQQQNHTNVTQSAFTPVNRSNSYQTMPQEYSQTGNWNTQPSNHKISSKTTMIPTGHYPHTSYPIPSQQQPIFFQTYPYPSLSSTVLQVFAPIEHWPSTGFQTPLESYQYAHTNYVPTYTNPRHYHQPTKHNQPSFDKEFFAQYGQQTRPSNTDVSYQQQTSTSSQSTQDTPITTSKLSPTAAAFSQGAPLTSSPSNTTFYVSPMPLSMPNYHPDRGFSYSHAPPPPPLDNRDHRNGANNRTNYYHYGQ